jgi:hypothetical protein
MSTKENPIEASKGWLVDCGYSKKEAENLLRAIYHDDPEKLWELAPKWIEYVGEHKRYQIQLLDLVATGLMRVTARDDGEWLFSLNDKGLEVGRQMFGGSTPA